MLCIGNLNEPLYPHSFFFFLLANYDSSQSHTEPVTVLNEIEGINK